MEGRKVIDIAIPSFSDRNFLIGIVWAFIASERSFNVCMRDLYHTFGEAGQIDVYVFHHKFSQLKSFSFSRLC